MRGSPMGDDNREVPPESTDATPRASETGEAEQLHPLVTRRDFLIGLGVGAVGVGVAAGAGFAATQGSRQTAVAPPAVQTAPGGPAVAVPPAPGAAPAAPQPATAPAPAQAPAAGQALATGLPLSMRRVSLNVDGVAHDVVVDVRESLWDTMIHKLGMSNTNLGCDRAMCGACAIVMDGRAV